MRWWWILPVTVLLLLASLFIPVGKRSHFCCADCGLYFQDRVMFGLDMPKYERRARTDWYDRRIGTPHGHRWLRSSCTAGLNLWQQPMSFGCGSVERLVVHHEFWVKVLERLELLNLDLPFHAMLTHAQESNRRAAADAGEFCDPAWNDDDVRAWWSKTQRFLATPSAWEPGFRTFEGNSKSSP